MLDSFDDIFINRRLVTSNDAFDVCRVHNCQASLYDLYSTSFLLTIQVYPTSLALNHKNFQVNP